MGGFNTYSKILIILSTLVILSSCNNSNNPFHKFHSQSGINSIPQDMDNGVLTDPPQNTENMPPVPTTTSTNTNTTSNTTETASNSDVNTDEDLSQNINDILGRQGEPEAVDINTVNDFSTLGENEVPTITTYPDGVETIPQDATTSDSQTTNQHVPFTPPQDQSVYDNYSTYDALKPVAGGASKFIKYAYWVVNNEASKIGTPCNFYVSRVLHLTGYSRDSFMANDFKFYAKKNFASFEDETFDGDYQSSERIRLKKYIWSFPERTPFIANWVRAGNHGHIAIIERIGNALVIYQAKMGQSIAKREQTTVDIMMSMASRNSLTLYSNFYPR